MKKSNLLFVILILAPALRLGGLSLPYHQDEWKTALGISQGTSGTTGLYHPPLTQILFQLDGRIFGLDYLRSLPLIFGILSAGLLYLVLKKMANQDTGVIGVFLYSVSFFAVWGSLQLDTDGAILPTFFLLAVYAYQSALNAQARKWVWWSLTATALLLGLLVKLSFILVVGTIIFDFIIRQWQAGRRREIGFALLGLVGLGGIFTLGLIVIHWLYPAFSIAGMIEHARSFAHLGGRSYLQIGVESLKALMYLSPLVLILACVPLATWRQARLFWLYLVFGFIFYYLIFDFSHGALDKYLVYAVAPIIGIVALAISTTLNLASVRQLLWGIWLGLGATLILIALNFLPHRVIPLYPKTAWFSAVLHGDWTILTPFTGGSGPVGFYVSFLFIAASFIIAAGLVLTYWLRPTWRPAVLMALVVVALGYNAIFIEELIAGTINGSAPVVIRQARDYLASTPADRRVITYNDTAAFELYQLNKYEARFYAAPQYEAVHRALFASFKGDYLIVDVPRFNSDSFYGKFFATCRQSFSATSRQISAKVYSC